MIIESVKCLKTLRAGENTWIKGTVFPNRNCPSIPADVLGEALQGRPTVEILSWKPEEDTPPPVFDNTPTNSDVPEFEAGTSTTQDVKMSLRNTELESPEVEKPVETKRSKPGKKKPSLAKRK